MTSRRKRRQEASRRGLSDRELELADLLEEVLEVLRWHQILGYANQFLIDQHLEVSGEERDRVLRAATKAVEKDVRLARFKDRLARVRGAMIARDREIGDAVRAELDAQEGEALGGS